MNSRFLNNHIVQAVLLFLLFIFLASIFLNLPLLEIHKKLTTHIDAYLVGWIWSWEAHILSTHPLDLFQANMFAPFKNSLALTETTLGGFLLALPALLIFNNAILAYNLVALLTFAISGLGTYLLVFYLTQNKWASWLAAFIYAFAPFKLIHGIEHLHVTGMWLPFVFLYLHKFFKNQSWKNTFLLTLFIILVFLTGFHYFIFLPIVILIFGIGHLASQKFKFNKNNLIKITISVIVLLLFVIPLILPYFQLKNTYNFTRSVEEIEGYAPNLIDYLISPWLYEVFYSAKTHIEMIVSPGIFVLLLLVFSLFLIKKNRKDIPHEHKIFFIIYGSIGLIAFLVSFGFYIQLTAADKGGMLGPFALLYYLIPGFNGIRGVGRYSIFLLLPISIFIGYGIYLWLIKNKDFFKRALFFFFIILFLCLEFSFVPVVEYRYVKISDDDKNLYTWLKAQESNHIYLELPMGYNLTDGSNYDIIYVFNSRLHFKKIVNGYSGYYPSGYFNLIYELQTFEPDKDLPALKKFSVDYIIFHFNQYPHPEEVKADVVQKTNNSQKVKFITNFGNNYVYEIKY